MGIKVPDSGLLWELGLSLACSYVSIITSSGWELATSTQWMGTIIMTIVIIITETQKDAVIYPVQNLDQNPAIRGELAGPPKP